MNLISSVAVYYRKQAEKLKQGNRKRGNVCQRGGGKNLARGRKLFTLQKPRAFYGIERSAACIELCGQCKQLEKRGKSEARNADIRYINKLRTCACKQDTEQYKRHSKAGTDIRYGNNSITKRKRHVTVCILYGVARFVGGNAYSRG